MLETVLGPVFDALGDLPRWAFELGFVSYVLCITGLLVLERRRPTATLAWILVLVFLPFVGIAIYYFVGRRRVHVRRRRRANRVLDLHRGTATMANLDALPSGLPDVQRGLVNLALRTAAAPVRRAGSVRVIDDPTQAYEALTEAIRGAKSRIQLLFYIWKDDPIARELTALLVDRARAGIRVRVLLDHVGTLGTPSSHFDDLREAGGEVALFGRLRVPFRLAPSRVNFRNHRKIVTVDGSRGFVGGINVGEEYLREDPDSPKWRDLVVCLDGDATLGLDAIFCDDWYAATGDPLDVVGGAPPGASLSGAPLPAAQHMDTPMESEGPLLQIIPSGPDLPFISSVASQFTAAIGSAQSRCYIATPYFVPDEALAFTLKTAALRGVDVRILVPAPHRSDARLVSWASRSYYDELIGAGCRIFEYQAGMLHAKYMVVDHDVAAVGSANMDVRSFHINYEVTAMFYNAQVTRELAEVFGRDCEEAREVPAQERTQTPLGSRLIEGTARLLSPIL